MAWEWVGTSTVAIAGIVATYLGGARGRRHAKELADSKNDHDLLLAREERQQKRQEEAYIEVLTLAHQFGHALSIIKLEFVAGSPNEFPAGESVARMRALLAAFGSDKVSTSYNTWVHTCKAINDFRNEVSEKGGAKSDENVEEFRKLKLAEHVARTALGEQVAEDLSSTPPQ